MSNSSNSSVGGVGITGVLFIVFLVLKLTDHIDWSWWWVTAPLWIPCAVAGAIILVCLGMYAIGAILNYLSRRS
jgi:hypothetical protein